MSFPDHIERNEVIIIKDSQVRINRSIRVKEVRLIDENGEQKGIVNALDALKHAEEVGLDLVEIAPNSAPPVCKVMDFKKYLYEVEKKRRNSRKKQVIVHLKEIKLRPNISDHDYEFKRNHIVRFLEKGDRVKISVFFKGREMDHQDRGMKIINQVIEDLKDTMVVEKRPSIDGRKLFAVLAPKR